MTTVPTFGFELLATDGQARLGRISTAHGPVDTPAFMPIGTAGTVKGMLPGHVADTGAQMVLGNTYHLMLRPGAERVGKLGGLHKFMNWPGPILTDSGGFQVMSLTDLRDMSEDGVRFRSHIDGSYHLLTPESSMNIQRLLDADITMAFDECTPFPATEDEARSSMALSMRWAKRSRDAFVPRTGYGLFGIVQGGIYESLRRESVQALRDIDFEGYAVGGLAVGEGPELMQEVLSYTAPLLPHDKPRYLMGVGRPQDLVASVKQGIDMFDCVMPTRSGRTSQAFTPGGAINLRNARHAEDPRPVDASCTCPCCTQFSRAYIHHLVKAGEMLGGILLTWHNLHYYQTLMQRMRKAISENSFAAFETTFWSALDRGDIEPL